MPFGRNFPLQREEVNSKHMVAVKTLLSRGFIINIIFSFHTDHCSPSHFPVTDSELFHLSSGYFMHKSKRWITTADGMPENGIGE